MKGYFTQCACVLLDRPAALATVEAALGEFRVIGHRPAVQGWAFGGAPGILRAFSDMITDQNVNDSGADFVRAKIAEIVRDPQTAEDLTPRDHPIGAKRLCVGTDYFETYNRPNVALVNVRRAPITRITPTGIATSDAEYPVDTIVFAIGFDAIGARVVGTRMAGLRGAVYDQRLAHSGLLLKLPAERLMTVTGRPREAFVPRPR